MTKSGWAGFFGLNRIVISIRLASERPPYFVKCLIGPFGLKSVTLDLAISIQMKLVPDE